MDVTVSPWHGRRVFVTGCTGFLGGAVARALVERGATVVGLVRDRAAGAAFSPEVARGRFHVVYGRVEDEARLRTAMSVHEVSAVFHLARADRADSLLRAATRYHSRVPVLTARRAGQLRLAGNDDSAGLLGVARFGELFGPGDSDPSRTVPRTVTSALAGRVVSAVNSPVRDFVFVRDAARALLALAEAVAVAVAGHSMDVTFRSGWTFSDAAVAGVVADLLAGKTPDEPWSGTDNPCGWQPGSTLSQALTETVFWYRQRSLANGPLPPPDLRRAA